MLRGISGWKELTGESVSLIDIVALCVDNAGWTIQNLVTRQCGLWLDDCLSLTEQFGSFSINADGKIVEGRWIGPFVLSRLDGHVGYLFKTATDATFAKMLIT